MRPAAVALVLLGAVAQQAPPPPPPPPTGVQPRDTVRRPVAEPVGTGIIRGTVVAADTGSPIRKANVSLSPAAPPPTVTLGNAVPLQQAQQAQPVRPIGPRQATTDLQGTFEFTGLPAGSYRVSAAPGQFASQYLAMAYGGKRPSGPGSFDPGQTIQLADGQTFNKAAIVLPKGGVISGRVTDENANPVTRVQVYPLFFQPGSSRGQRSGAFAQTDDLGQFRIYGLQSGEYVVVAEARGNTFVSPNAPPEREEDKLGYVTTYYPGTPDEAAAQRVRAAVAAETSGIEIRLIQGRLYRLSGVVRDSQGRPVARQSVQLSKRTGASNFSSFGAPTDEQGQFQMKDLAPGEYRLIVQQSRPNPQGAADPRADPPEMALVPLSLTSDLENVLVTTGPGATITGQVVFEQGPPSPLPAGMRIIPTPGSFEDMGPVPMPQPAVVSPSLTFTMKGLMTALMLRSTAPNQYLKSVTLNGEDITDTPREFRTNDRVVVTLTSRASTLEGDVTASNGPPPTDAAVMLFSEDKASWRTNAIRTKRANLVAPPAPADGPAHFQIPGVLPGRYYIVAASRGRLNIPPGADETFFEQLSKEATLVVIGDDEQRKVDLKMLDEVR